MIRCEIKLTGIRVLTQIGINPEEQTQKQELFVSVQLWIKRKAYRLDSNHDYVRIKEAMMHFADQAEIPLLEDFAYQLAKYLKTFCKAQKVEVEIQKPYAAQLMQIESVAVRQFA